MAPRKLPPLRALFERASPVGGAVESLPDYSQDPFHMVLVRGISLPGEKTMPCPLVAHVFIHLFVCFVCLFFALILKICCGTISLDEFSILSLL